MQELTYALWSDPSSGRRLAHASVVYATLRDALLDALKRQNVSAESRSGFNVWVPVHEETATVQHLAASGWAVAAGERFRIRSGPAIRITTAALPVTLADALAANIAAAVRPSTARIF